MESGQFGRSGDQRAAKRAGLFIVEFPAQGPFADAEQGGGFFSIEIRPFKGCINEHFFRFGQGGIGGYADGLSGGTVQTGFNGRQGGGEKVGGDLLHIAGQTDSQSGHVVAKLTDIAGPGIG